MMGAMIFGADAIAAAPAVALPTANDYYFWDNNGTEDGTVVPDYWFNKVGGELDAIISALGLTLSMTTRNQIAAALQQALAGVASDVAMSTLTDCNAPPALGSYVWQTTTANIPAANTYGIITTISSVGSAVPAANNSLVQIAYDVSSEEPPFFRENIGNNGWAAWQQYALSTGSATTQFSVANATGAQQAVPLGQAEAIFANITGNPTNQFVVAPATNTNPAAAVPLSQAESLFANITGSGSNQFAVAPATSSNPAAAVSLSQFVASFGAQGSLTLPNGFILKWGSAMTVANGTVSSFALATPFPNNHFFCIVSFGSAVPPVSGSVGCDPNGVNAINITNTYTNGETYGVHYICIGN